MKITAQQVNELRKRTGAGMMDCKNALVETEGDMEKAIDVLRKKVKKLLQNVQVEMLLKVLYFQKLVKIKNML